ncbi:MAG: hypothetical protein HOW97_40595 [Catenulispora sp.]|nr:hypothetical protein [Catenulispora sp.]
MFTEASRDQTLRALIQRAEADPDVSGAVLYGSTASGAADRWSDLDMGMTVRDPAAVAERWTAALDPVHHWDLATGGGAFIRVFLLADGLEIDLGFFPEGGLVQRGAWRPVFGDFEESTAWKDSAPADPRLTIGMAWHHLLHVRVCIERGRLWQAEYWIGQTRAHLIALVCLRFGLPTHYAKGAHLLPSDASDALALVLAPTLVRSVDEAELRRALSATIDAFDAELRHHDPGLADRLKPILNS